MRKKIFSSLLLIFLVLIPGLISCGKNTATAVSSDEISIDGLRQHMEYIASDETEGRMTASIGYKKAADYVVKHFKSFGLTPGWTDEKEGKTYYQPVSFLRYHNGDNNVLSVRIDGETDRYPNDQMNYAIFYPGKGSEEIPEGNPVFVGYGIHEPDLGWDDFKGLDIKDKLVIIIAGFPNNPNSGPNFPSEVRQKYRDRRTGDLQRFTNVVDRGAAGMIAVPDRNIVRNWDYVMAQRKRANLIPTENYDPSSPGESPIPTVVLHENLVNRLFKDAGFKPITHEGDYRTMEMKDVELGLSIDIKKEVVDCFNIIGIIPGSDPALSEEYLTVGGHLDHLGRDEEFIYYGANDNASSCVLILEVAKVLAKNPSKRSVVFILFTAEEIGHFGSLHYVAHPAVPHDQVRLNINLEQIGARTRNVDGIWAIGPSSEEATFLSIRDKVGGIELGFDDIESQVNVISGSDTLSFYLKQHPAIILGSGGFPEHHQPSDNIDLIDFNHLYRASLFVLSYIEELGNN